MVSLLNRPIKSLLLSVLVALLLIVWSPICSAQATKDRSDPERIRVQLALAAAVNKHRSYYPTAAANIDTRVADTKLPATITVKGKTLYLCDGGTCYCPIENCKCVDGKCTCGTSSRPPFLGNCKCGLDCPCHAGECGDLSCPTAHGPKTMKVSTQADTGFLEWTAYEIQYNKAFSQKKPLLIWIGETCDSCEQQWTDYIHARLSINTYNSNSSTQVTEPCVKVCKPGEVGMNVIGTIDNIPSRLAVTSMLSEREGQSTIQAQPQIIQRPIYQPQFIQPMMPIMGGFGGGGMMGGGCFGGGCSS